MIVQYTHIISICGGISFWVQWNSSIYEIVPLFKTMLNALCWWCNFVWWWKLIPVSLSKEMLHWPSQPCFIPIGFYQPALVPDWSIPGLMLPFIMSSWEMQWLKQCLNLDFNQFCFIFLQVIRCLTSLLPVRKISISNRGAVIPILISKFRL